MIGTTAALIGLGISAAAGTASSLVGASKASSAAEKAAQAQGDSTKYAADLQKKASDDALAFEKEIWATQQEQQQPWIDAGTTALGQLATGTAAGGDLVKPFDASTVSMDPGFDFRLAEGMKALDRSAAARTGVLNGGAVKAAERYAQDYSSGEYDKAYSRTFNEYQTGQTNTYNRLAALAGLGQTATSTLGQQGSTAASGVTNNLITTGTSLADLATQAGNARASGYVGSGNAWNGALGGVSSNLSSLAMLAALFGRGK